MDENMKARIEKRAYELFVARGGQDGYHMEDWLKAESEILKAEEAATAHTEPGKPAGKPGPRKRKG
jgi:hypothetical protein